MTITNKFDINTKILLNCNDYINTLIIYKK
jgi:hypothetical protein